MAPAKIDNFPIKSNVDFITSFADIVTSHNSVVPNLWYAKVFQVVREYILFVIRPKGVLSSSGVDFEFFGAVDVV